MIIPLCNLLVIDILMFPWKDCAMTIFIIVLTAYLVHIYFTDGAWLTSKINLIMFAVMAALCSLMRHNAFFFTVPLFITLTCLFRKKWKSVASSAAIALFLVIMVRGPLFRALHVEYPSPREAHIFLESSGMYYTIAGACLVQDPDSIPPATKEILLQFAPLSFWQEHYIPGSFHSIRYKLFNLTLNQLKIIPRCQQASELFFMWEQQPRTAWTAFACCTEQMWDIHHNFGLNNICTLKDMLDGKKDQQPFIIKCFTTKIYCGIYSVIACCGFWFLLLLMVHLALLPKQGINLLLFSVPITCYNMGTMFFFAGYDPRLIFYNMVIIPAILTVMLTLRTNNSGNQQGTARSFAIRQEPRRPADQDGHGGCCVTRPDLRSGALKSGNPVVYPAR